MNKQAAQLLPSGSCTDSPPRSPQRHRGFGGGVRLGFRAAQKIRAQEEGHGYAERKLIAPGAPPMRPGEKPAVWPRDALHAVGARKFRIPANTRYARREPRAVGGSNHPRGRDHRSYPKRDLARLDLFR